MTPILPSPDQMQRPGGVQQRAGAEAEKGGDSSTRSVLSSDFETFLQMLTAQAKYQDPLEPIDSTEYAAQLAQFSMVEQQVKTNDFMQQLLGIRGPADIASVADWIGREALTISPANFTGTPITIRPQPESGADQIVLVVKDSDGTVVQRRTTLASDAPIQWAGVKDDGSPFPSGEYSFEIESRGNGEILGTEPAHTYTRVTEARIENGDTLLLLDSGYLVRSDDVIGLREPV